MRNNYRAKDIAAMDETELQLDMPGRTTLEEQGSRTVAIKTTGHEDRFTVVLGARADGTKLQPMVIFKGKRKDRSLENITGVVVEMQENVWMTEELTLRWLRMLWGGTAATRDRRLLIWDVFRAHTTDCVKVCAQEVCNSDLCTAGMYVPPTGTRFVLEQAVQGKIL